MNRRVTRMRLMSAGIATAMASGACAAIVGIEDLPREKAIVIDAATDSPEVGAADAADSSSFDASDGVPVDGGNDAPSVDAADASKLTDANPDVVCGDAACDYGNVALILPGQANKLSGFWRFEGNFSDSSGLSHNGTGQGGASFGLGHIGQSGVFNGTTAYVALSGTILSSSIPYSVSLWVKPVSNTGDVGLYYSGPMNGCNPSGQYLSLRSGVPFESVGCGTEVLAGSVPSAVWTHVVVTRSQSSQVSLYVGGVLVSGPTNNTNGNAVGVGNDMLGAYWGGNVRAGFFNGALDDVAIWNGVALSASEVAQLYSMSK